MSLAPTIAQRLESIMPAQPGVYVESGIGGTVVATIFDANGKQIRQDHIAAEHFDPETLNALSDWANRHREQAATRTLS